MIRKKINDKDLEEQILIKIKKRESETQALKKILSAFEMKEQKKEIVVIHNSNNNAK